MKTTIFILVAIFLIAGCINAKVETNIVQQKEGKISRDMLGLAEAKSSQIVELKNNEMLQLAAMLVSKEIEGRRLKMYAYNGEIPGPTIKVKQGSKIFVNFTNNIDFDTTVHWHGIRLNNKFDGVPNITQMPIKPGKSFLYKLDFPDEGVYWYHPHIREDLQQELGLYGNIFVVPESEYYFNKVDKEVFLFLDDIRMAKTDVEVFNSNFARLALMGRFGNIMLINGETDYKLNVKKGDIIRFYITNSANTRTFNFSIQNHKIKLIGSDSGKFEREEFADSVILSVAERYIIEVLFDKVGVFEIYHKTPDKIYTIGTIKISDNNKNQ
ncbi:multicopper oxidase domain-containing protein, partial [Candidatus Woesearchaeota archaeon]|nr:multicopper oxidase domain-containing protein [Candidatus Woesearchaeota archaeon]